MFNYYCDCSKENFELNNYSYWENKKTTKDEMDIIKYLKKNCNLKNKLIMHIGIGNSKLSQILQNFSKIKGISISKKEINYAKSLNNKKYDVFFYDKYSIQFKNYLIKKKFDYIIDANLKSYACCDKSFRFMFKNMVFALKKKGFIITSRKGMNWTKTLTPKMSFNLKNFFYYKLKEVEGKKENKLTINECKKIAHIYSLKLKYDNNICLFKK